MTCSRSRLDHCAHSERVARDIVDIAHGIGDDIRSSKDRALAVATTVVLSLVIARLADLDRNALHFTLVIGVAIALAALAEDKLLLDRNHSVGVPMQGDKTI